MASSSALSHAVPDASPSVAPDGEQVSGSSAGRAKPRKFVHIFTFGLENLDNDLHNECSFQGGGARAKVSDWMLRESLRKKLDADRARVDILTDCRAFGDPAAMEGPICKHLGCHPQVMNKMAQNRNFGGFIRKMRRE